MKRPTLSILAVALSTACGPGPQQQVDTRTLDALNQELSNVQLQEAMVQRLHFAPLCDENGYPLVGNIVSKTTGATASGVCAELRRQPK